MKGDTRMSCLRILVMLIITFIVTSCSPPSYSIIKTAVLNNRPPSKHSPSKDITSKNTIDPLADESVILYFALQNYQKKYVVELKLYKPDGAQHYTTTRVMNQSNATYTYYYDWFVINSLTLLNYPGLWRAEFYIDNVKSESQTFMLVDRPELRVQRNNFYYQYKYYYVGIDTDDSNKTKDDNASSGKVKQSNKVIVTRVHGITGNTSPAAKAGLNVDDIITEISGTPISSSSAAVDLFVHPSDPNDLYFKVYRPSINKYLSLKIVPERITNNFHPDAGKAMRDYREYIKSPEIFAEKISKMKNSAQIIDLKEKQVSIDVISPSDFDKKQGSSNLRQNQVMTDKTLDPPVVVTASKEKKTATGLNIPHAKYHALIIGNNNYTSLPKLITARNDAKTVATILKNDYGFEITLIEDATRAAMLLEIGKLRERLTVLDNLLIYYAGHGWLDKEGDEGYWLPIDATKDNEINWISNSSITTQLKAMEAKHVLVVADSCYSGKLGRGVHIEKRASNYYSRIASKRARSVISSGGLEPVIDSGGKGDYSVFASAFIEALKDNKDVIDATELFNQIKRPVALNADQTPEYADIRKAGHDGGDFIFIRKP